MEEFMTFSLLLLALYKWNILSIVYYLISIKMILSNVSIQFRMKVSTYIWILVLLQYILWLTNWNKLNSPQLIPAPFNMDIEGLVPYNYHISPPLQLPWVDMIKISESWKKYLLIDKNIDILHSLVGELMIIWVSSAYIYIFSPFLYNTEKDKMRDYLKVRSDLDKNKVFLDYVQSSSIYAAIYKEIRSILFSTWHIFMIVILLSLTSQNSGVLAIAYLWFALFYLYQIIINLMNFF